MLRTLQTKSVSYKMASLFDTFAPKAITEPAAISAILAPKDDAKASETGHKLSSRRRRRRVSVVNASPTIRAAWF